MPGLELLLSATDKREERTMSDAIYEIALTDVHDADQCAAVAEAVNITGPGTDPEPDKTPTSYFTDALMEDLIADLGSRQGQREASARVVEQFDVGGGRAGLGG